MSRYFQTLSSRDQAILNHPFYCYYSRPPTRFEEQPINALWSNSGYISSSLPDPIQDLAPIRRVDIIAFREIWLQTRPPSANLPGPLRGCFTPMEWTQSGGGYMTAHILAYRTFALCVYSETPDDALE